jgi:hypothetical protein
LHRAFTDISDTHIAATPAYQRSRHERKKIEMLFVHLKRILKTESANICLL